MLNKPIPRPSLSLHELKQLGDRSIAELNQAVKDAKRIARDSGGNLKRLYHRSMETAVQQKPYL